MATEKKDELATVDLADDEAPPRTWEDVLALASAEYVTGCAEWSRIQCAFAAFSSLVFLSACCDLLIGSMIEVSATMPYMTYS